MLPQEIIRTKREGGALSAAQIQAFVAGLTSTGADRWGDSQAAALAMAILLRGMNTVETVALTHAMTHSGEVLQWADAGLNGPVLDKHSTGGVGDKVSLMLAPMVAACGALVPMISGRGLGHTGGTLDKLEALSGYDVDPDRSTLRTVLRESGCAIVGASAALAPADRRLYAIRDLTATVESVPLITASILSKKLAAGLQGLVLDVKCGSGAFAPTLEQARQLAGSLVAVAGGAGLPARAVITSMDQVLGHTAGNALEVQEAIDFLTGAVREPRLLEVTLVLGEQMLLLGGLAATLPDARAALQRSLDSGAAAERFARMVAGLGGPADVLHHAGLAMAPVCCDVPAPRAGWLARLDVRALGVAVVALGGGRAVPGQPVDPRVGLSQVLPLGAVVLAGQPLARVHAADVAAAQAAVAAVQCACQITDGQPAAAPLVLAGD